MLRGAEKALVVVVRPPLDLFWQPLLRIQPRPAHCSERQASSSLRPRASLGAPTRGGDHAHMAAAGARTDASPATCTASRLPSDAYPPSTTPFSSCHFRRRRRCTRLCAFTLRRPRRERSCPRASARRRRRTQARRSDARSKTMSQGSPRRGGDARRRELKRAKALLRFMSLVRKRA